MSYNHDFNQPDFAPQGRYDLRLVDVKLWTTDKNKAPLPAAEHSMTFIFTIVGGQFDGFEVKAWLRPADRKETKRCLHTLGMLKKGQVTITEHSFPLGLELRDKTVLAMPKGYNLINWCSLEDAERFLSSAPPEPVNTDSAVALADETPF